MKDLTWIDRVSNPKPRGLKSSVLPLDQAHRAFNSLDDFLIGELWNTWIDKIYSYVTVLEIHRIKADLKLFYNVYLIQTDTANLIWHKHSVGGHNLNTLLYTLSIVEQKLENILDMTDSYLSGNI